MIISVETSKETPQLFPTDSELIADFLAEFKLTLGKGGWKPYQGLSVCYCSSFSRYLGTKSRPKLLKPSRAKGFSGMLNTSYTRHCLLLQQRRRLAHTALWWGPKSRFLSGSSALFVGNFGKLDVVNRGKSRILLGACFDPLDCAT